MTVILLIGLLLIFIASNVGFQKMKMFDLAS